jgi:thiamine-monophosphate kinase
VAGLSELGEFGFIERIAQLAGAPPANVITGIGDDCAIIEIGRPEKLLATADAVVEGRHFDLDWMTPYEVGQRAAAGALSDIAAMGGTPFASLCSAAVPTSLPLEVAEDVMRGLANALRKYGAPLIGGDTVAASDALVLNLCILGWARTPWRRSGARVGDTLALTGPLGEAAAALALALDDPASIRLPRHSVLLERLVSPVPRLQEAAVLARSPAVHAAVDISDGLYLDAGHVASRSHVRLVLDLGRIPVSEAAQQATRRGSRAPWWPATSGEEYELLLAIAPGMIGTLTHNLREAGLGALIEIGQVVPGSGVVIVHPDGSEVEMDGGGWDHFRASE